ncbi:MAG: autotransporter domain-containing protein, partial [Candidatus Omnitrophota bacterium]
TYTGSITLTADSGVRAEADKLIITSVIAESGGSYGITKSGPGIVELTNSNTYTGGTNLESGTLSFIDGSLGSSGTIDFTGNAVLQWAVGNTEDLSGRIQIEGAVTATLDIQTNDVIFANTLQVGTSQTGAVTKTGAGTLTLSGTNTYTGVTTVNAGTLAFNGDCGLGGDLTLTGTGALTLGTNTITLSGTQIYTQGAGTTLNVGITSSSIFGNIIAIDGNASVDAGSIVNVVLSEYIADGTIFTIIDGKEAGGGVSVPTTITSNDSRVVFLGSSLNGDLVLTANRTSNGFAADAKDSNSVAVGDVLDNMQDPTSDMQTILNTMEGLSSSQVASALDTMVPAIDAGIVNNSTAVLNNFVGTSLNRLKKVLSVTAAGNSVTGISSGDEEKLNSIWAKGYGSYLDQGTRKGILGFTAWNSGTAVGVDHISNDVFTIGIAGGYAYGHVNSAANSGKTNISSGQGTIYAGYRDPDVPYFIDVVGSFAWNWYAGNREIIVGAINRKANADYDGQQYGVYLDGGYKFELGKTLEFTPLASIQWNHLHLAGYTETEAGSMNLTMNQQNYGILQSGLGASIVSVMKYEWGNISPEFHAKWLYNFINDAMATTSTFTGGGASFGSNGVKSAKNGVNLGGTLSFDSKNDVSFIVGCDTEIRDESFSVYGSAALRYKF